MSQTPPNKVDYHQQSVHFAGDITFVGGDLYRNRIYVQDYRYNGITIPESFRYAAWNTSNGSTSSASFALLQELPATATNTAIQDLKDNYWLLTQGSPVSVERQIQDIRSVVRYSNGRSPQGNAKLVGPAIASFTVPNFTTAQGTVLPLHIVAVQSEDPTQGEYDSTDLIPVNAGATITLPTNNQDTLYNFDFHADAKYTLHEAVDGVTALADADLTDPAEAASIPGYPTYSTYAPGATVAPRVTNATTATFKNALFTTLASQVVISDKSTTVLAIGATAPLSGQVLQGYTHSTLANQPAATVDAPTVAWFSSDPSIATVDSNGVVTAAAEGTVRIYLKATDEFNAGEIEKPFDFIDLDIKPEYTVTFTYEDQAGNALPAEVLAGIDPLPAPVKALKGGDVAIPARTTTTYVMANGSGTWTLTSTPAPVQNIQADQTVAWVWSFTANPKVAVNFAFIDEAGDPLPAEVQSGVGPVPAGVEVFSGQNVTPPVLATTTYSMANGSGSWALREQPAPLVGVTEATTVNYVWRFTEAAKHPVVFQFADEGGNALPAEVLAAVGPVPASVEVYDGQNLTPPILATTSYLMADRSGTWSLTAQPAALTNVTAPATVVYVWRFAPNVKVTVDFAFVDEDGDALPAEVLGAVGPVPGGVEVYSGVDVTPPALSTTSYSMTDGSGTWSLTAQPTTLRAVTVSTTVNYVWAFVENAKVPVDFRFVDTASRALHAEVLSAVGPVPAAMGVYPGQTVTPPVLAKTSYRMADGTGVWTLTAQPAALSNVTEPVTVDYVWQFAAAPIQPTPGKNPTPMGTDQSAKGSGPSAVARTGADINALAVAAIGFFAAGALITAVRRRMR